MNPFIQAIGDPRGLPLTGRGPQVGSCLYGVQAGRWTPIGATGVSLNVTTAAGGSVVVVGNATPADNFANPSNAVPAWALTGLFDGATWDRARSGGNDTATKAAVSSGAQEVLGSLYGFGTNSGLWTRLFSTNIGGQFAGGDGALLTFAALASFQPASAQYVGLRTGPNSPGGITSLYVKDGPPVISAEASPTPFLHVDTPVGVIKNAAGNLLSLSFSGLAAGGYFCIVNSNVNPIVGSVAILAYAVPGAGLTVPIGRDQLAAAGINLSAGIAFAYATGINPANNQITGLAAAALGTTVCGTRV